VSIAEIREKYRQLKSEKESQNENEAALEAFAADPDKIEIEVEKGGEIYLVISMLCFLAAAVTAVGYFYEMRKLEK
jgi:hypothetical protein